MPPHTRTELSDTRAHLCDAPSCVLGRAEELHLPGVLALIIHAYCVLIGACSKHPVQVRGRRNTRDDT